MSLKNINLVLVALFVCNSMHATDSVTRKVFELPMRLGILAAMIYSGNKTVEYATKVITMEKMNQGKLPNGSKEFVEGFKIGVKVLQENITKGTSPAETQDKYALQSFAYFWATLSLGYFLLFK